MAAWLWLAHLVNVLCSLDRTDVVFVIEFPHGGAHVCECVLDREGTSHRQNNGFLCIIHTNRKRGLIDLLLSLIKDFFFYNNILLSDVIGVNKITYCGLIYLIFVRSKDNFPLLETRS